jgi:hypothetical protein
MPPKGDIATQEVFLAESDTHQERYPGTSGITVPLVFLAKINRVRSVIGAYLAVEQ